ncbi:MAG: hypothetical protein V3U34_00735 [candidate division NC10 bacterium]
MSFILQDVRDQPVLDLEELVEAYNREASPVLRQIREEANKAHGNLVTVVNAGTFPALASVREVIVNDGIVLTVELPPAADVFQQRYLVKKAGSSGDVVTVAAQAGETIDGAATVALSTTFGWLEVLSDGLQWFKVAEG